MKTIILATNNKGKILDFNCILRNQNWLLEPQSNHGIVEDVEETGSTFLENALIKARHSASITNMPTIADDSGICVDALKGAPGVYSARYAGSECDSNKNNAKLLLEMQNVSMKDRQAHFVCCLVYINGPNDENPIICEERWNGFILFESAGKNGFGYDSLFYVPEYQCSAAQLDIDTKNTVSHRAKALRKMQTMLNL